MHILNKDTKTRNITISNFRKRQDMCSIPHPVPCTKPIKTQKTEQHRNSLRHKVQNNTTDELSPDQMTLAQELNNFTSDPHTSHTDSRKEL